MVNLAVDSRLGQNLSGLLEGCCRQEGIGSQGCLGNTKHNLLALCRLLALCDQSLIHLIEVQNIHGNARQHIAVAALLNADLL